MASDLRVGFTREAFGFPATRRPLVACSLRFGGGGSSHNSDIPHRTSRSTKKIFFQLNNLNNNSFLPRSVGVSTSQNFDERREKKSHERATSKYEPTWDNFCQSRDDTTSQEYDRTQTNRGFARLSLIRRAGRFEPAFLSPALRSVYAAEHEEQRTSIWRADGGC
jgi:hypothetical protein